MIKNEIIFYIIVPLISSLIGGGLTLIGVLISIHHENKNRKNEIKRLNKPLIYLINPMQDYDYKSAVQFYFENKIFKSNGFIEIILKNTDNAIMIMDSIKIGDDIYYPTNGNVVDKNTIFYIYVYINEKIKSINQENIMLTIKDVLGNSYKYKLIYSDENSKSVDVIEEMTK